MQRAQRLFVSLLLDQSLYQRCSGFHQSLWAIEQESRFRHRVCYWRNHYTALDSFSSTSWRRSGQPWSSHQNCTRSILDRNEWKMKTKYLNWELSNRRERFGSWDDCWLKGRTWCAKNWIVSVLNRLDEVVEDGPAIRSQTMVTEYQSTIQPNPFLSLFYSRYSFNYLSEASCWEVRSITMDHDTNILRFESERVDTCCIKSDPHCEMNKRTDAQAPPR